MRARPLVIGLGNAQRADDGFGPLVAALLEGTTTMRLITRSADALALIDEWTAQDRVFLIDAAQSIGRPGTLHRIDCLADDHASVTEQPTPAMRSASSTHGFGLAEAIGVARTLGRLPRQLVLYTVEASRFERGAVMTAAVARAAERTAALLRAEMQDG